MELPVQTFTTLVGRMAAGLQGRAAQLIDLTIGSVLRALLESCASVVLWLQWLILLVLATTRAATSNGPDLDSWMADFSFRRLPGSAATGVLTFNRYTIGAPATVPVGTTVLTADGQQGFIVVEDLGNPAWNGLGGYTIAAQQSSVDVPAACTLAGPVGNVQAGTIALIASPLSGIDTVSNLANFGGGMDAEADAAFRVRFSLYINSRSLATISAILNAVASVQVGLRTQVIENVDSELMPREGSFLVVVDDGTGSPSPVLIGDVQSAVDAVRPIGSVFSVQPPEVVPVSVNVVIQTSNPLTHLLVATQAQSGILAWIHGLPIAGTLAISKIDAIVHATDPSVTSVTSTLINGTALDISAPVSGIVLPTSVTVT